MRYLGCDGYAVGRFEYLISVQVEFRTLSAVEDLCDVRRMRGLKD